MENTWILTLIWMIIDIPRSPRLLGLPMPYNQFPQLRPESKGDADCAAGHRTFLYLSALLWLKTTTEARKRNRSSPY